VTIDAQPCPDCDRTAASRWIQSTATTDTWACRCGHEWAITVEPLPGQGAR
jgi:hypothetical protein